MNAELGSSSSQQSQNTRGITQEEDSTINTIIRKETNVVAVKEIKTNEDPIYGTHYTFNYGNSTLITVAAEYHDKISFAPDWANILPGEKPEFLELIEYEEILRDYESQMAIIYLGLTKDKNRDTKDIFIEMSSNMLNIASQHKNDFKWWYFMTRTGGIMDLKNRKTGEIKIWSQTYLYNENYLRHDAFGNMLFGFVGYEVFGADWKAEAILKGGAGVFQMISNINLEKNIFKKTEAYVKYIESLVKGSWGDNEGDAEYIQYGIDAYKQYLLK